MSMRGLPAGEDLIALYYEIAPQILVAIRAQENAHDVLNHLYSVIQLSGPLFRIK